VYNNIVEFLSVPVRMFNVATEDSVGLRLSHSLLRAVGTTVSAVASAPPAAGERIVLDVDPRFVAPQAGDYRLQTGSPAAGAGVAVSLVKRNGQGQCRTEWNMGAF
jgi:hypothetical protein